MTQFAHGELLDESKASALSYFPPFSLSRLLPCHVWHDKWNIQRLRREGERGNIFFRRFCAEGTLNCCLPNPLLVSTSEWCMLAFMIRLERPFPAVFKRLPLAACTNCNLNLFYFICVVCHEHREHGLQLMCKSPLLFSQSHACLSQIQNPRRCKCEEKTSISNRLHRLSATVKFTLPCSVSSGSGFSICFRMPREGRASDVIK